MSQFPTHEQGDNQAVFHVVPDNIASGWNVYSTLDPHHRQEYFSTKQEAIAYAQRMSLRYGVGYVVELYEVPQAGMKG